jgi:hypothetical protein
MKAELRAEAVVLEKRLADLRKRLGHSAVGAYRELELLTDAPPRCRSVGRRS